MKNTAPAQADAARSDAVSLADSSWPMIHRNPSGDKDSPLPGPTSTQATVEVVEAPNGVILMPIGDEHIYVQTGIVGVGGGGVEAYRLGALQECVARVEMRAPFPYLAGGVVDAEGHVWWTETNRVVRFSAELTEACRSAPLEPRVTPYNSLNVLPDGNLLASGKQACHVIGYAPVDDELPVLSTLDLAQTLRLPRLSAPVIPRPVQDDRGGVLYNAGTTLVRLQYDAERTALEPEPTWRFECPQEGGGLDLSNPVLCGGMVFCVSNPPDDQAMRLYRLDEVTGERLSTTVPFPDALGVGTAHTLGASASLGLVFAISGTQDGAGGVAAVRADTGELVWKTSLHRVGGAMALSSASQRVYVIDRPESDGPCRVLAIGMTNGAVTVLYEAMADTDPTISLPSLAADGSLYAFVPPNLCRIVD